MKNFRKLKFLMKIILLMNIAFHICCLRPSDKSAGNDYSILLTLIGYSLYSVQQGPCGKFVTAVSDPQNLNFVPYITAGVNYIGSIVYLENVKSNNQLFLCSNVSVSFFQTANFSTRLGNNCVNRISNSPKVNDIFGKAVQVGNCLSYPILKEGSFTLSIFVEGESYPNDGQVYLQ